MSGFDPSEEFRDLVDAATTRAPAPSATIRVAEVHFGGDGLARTLEAAALEVVASLDPAKEAPDFGEMPAFDIVVASAPWDANEWAVTDYVLRFVRVRMPIAFVVQGCTRRELPTTLAEESRQYEHEISLNRREALRFAAGVDEKKPEAEAWGKIGEVVGNMRVA